MSFLLTHGYYIPDVELVFAICCNCSQEINILRKEILVSFWENVNVEAQGDYVLKLPSGLEVILKNILNAPSQGRY